MDKKRLITELRSFAHDGARSGQAAPGYEEFAACLADHLERIDLHYGENYLRRHIVQLVADAWELMRFTASAHLKRAAYLQATGYSEVPDLVNIGLSSISERSEAVKSIAFMLADIFSRDSEMLADAVEEEFLQYCEAQHEALLHALHGFLRRVWRQGLSKATAGKRRITVCMGDVDVRVAVTADTLQLTFIRDGKEFWFVGSPTDELGLEFMLVGADKGVTLDVARAMIGAAVDAELRRRSMKDQPYFIADSL